MGTGSGACAGCARVRRDAGDAFAVEPVPSVEVHLSDVENRDEWRKVSVFDGLVVEKISGKGVDGYKDAIDVLAALLDDERE